MYTKEQIIAAIDATDPECFVLHVLRNPLCDAVSVAMQLSHDKDGNLSAGDLELIQSLLP